MNWLERDASMTCVVAYVLWVVTFLFIFAGTVVGLVGSSGVLPIVLGLMAHGLALSAAAATVSIRAMLARQSALMRNAFDLGRDAGPERKVRGI